MLQQTIRGVYFQIPQNRFCLKILRQIPLWQYCWGICLVNMFWKYAPTKYYGNLFSDSPKQILSENSQTDSTSGILLENMVGEYILEICSNKILREVISGRDRNGFCLKILRQIPLREYCWGICSVSIFWNYAPTKHVVRRQNSRRKTLFWKTSKQQEENPIV